MIGTDSKQLERDDIDAMSLGDVSAFNRLYARYHRLIHANIIKLVKSPELSSELLQDVFLALWQNRYKFTGRESVGSWLFVVSHNKSLNMLRQKLKESVEYVADLPVELATEADNGASTEELHRIQVALLDEAVAILPARKKEVFQLCRYEGRTKEDVAAMLGISTQSVSDYLKQSNKAIKEYLSSNYPSYLTHVLLYMFLVQ